MLDLTFIYHVLYMNLITLTSVLLSKITSTHLLTVNSMSLYFYHELVVPRTDPPLYYSMSFTEYLESASPHPVFYQIPCILPKCTNNFFPQLLATLYKEKTIVSAELSDYFTVPDIQRSSPCGSAGVR